MADSKSSLIGGILRKPHIAGLILILILLIAGFGANFYVGTKESKHLDAYLTHTFALKSLSQEIAKNMSAALRGRIEVYPTLGENQDDFAEQLELLRTGDSLDGIEASPEAPQKELRKMQALWDKASLEIDQVLTRRDAIGTLRDIAGDLSITLAAIQDENNKLVADMLRFGLPPAQIARAQNQSLIIERMGRSVQKIVDVGGSKVIIENFHTDLTNFSRTLKGLANGDRELHLIAIDNGQIQARLNQVDEFSSTIDARMTEILANAEKVKVMRTAVQENALGSGEFLNLSNRLANVYRKSSALTIGSPIVGLALGIASLLIIFLISLLIYREASDNVTKAAQQNERNQSAILQLLDEMADLADGDLRVQATVTESFTGAIADSINFSIDQLRSLVSKINEASAMVTNATENTQLSLKQLSVASEQQAAEITDVSEAVNEMTTSIDKVSSNAAESSSVAERSVAIANNGASTVQDTIDGMENIRGQIQETAKRIKRLGESSQEIGDIVALINDIADQTNILSLNAAIQASMAGDAGKGFAVVADEVQRLAERSGAAAKQISALIKTIQSDTNEAVTSMETTTAEVVQGTKLAKDAGVALGEIESVSASLAETIGNISNAANEQARSAGTISNTMQSIQSTTSKTTEETRSTVTAMVNLSEITDELRSSVSGFKLPD